MSLLSGSIRLPRIRFTVRRLMIAVATIAVSLCMFNGIGHLSIFQENVAREAFLKNEAARLEFKKNSLAELRRQDAEFVARQNRHEIRPPILTAACVLVLGVIAGAIHLVARWQYPTWVQHQRRLMVGLVDVCSSVATVSLAGTVVGCSLYLMIKYVLNILRFMIDNGYIK